MREARNAQTSIFDFYAEHEHGHRLKRLSGVLDEHPDFVALIAQDFDKRDAINTGARGMSIESILRCLLLKQILGVSYRTLAFHLCDSQTYRTFARLKRNEMPKHASLQSTIRRVRYETLQAINQRLMSGWIENGDLSIKAVRIDSTVVESNIAPPLDSQMLNDGVRVLSRLMFNSKEITGVKVRFVDQRKRSRSLAFRLFHAKRTEKDALYPKLLSCVAITLRQVSRAIENVRREAIDIIDARQWIKEVEHYRALLLKVIDQTQRRVYNDEKVPCSEKIVSLFEPHTDIIVKGFRDVQYGHKINLATQLNGFVTYLNIEKGNPADAKLYLPVLGACQEDYGTVPESVVADGCYVSQANVATAKAFGVKRTVFNKPTGLGLHEMGVKKKTFIKLRNFRAGIEGNISELKRAFGISRVNWKGLDGFKAYVWSSVLSYNLVRWVRLDPG